MQATADLYFSIRSPFSYLAIRYLEQRLPDQPHAIEMQLRPVMPIAVRKPEMFKSINPLAMPYLELDATRAAERYGIPIRVWPVPDPIQQDMDTLEIAAEQPYIHRLTYLMQAACEAGVGIEFARRLATLIWDGNTDNWQQGDHIARVADAAGLSLAALDAAIEQSPAHYAAEIEANQRRLHEAGHWGVPTIVYRGEPFFGQDRVDTFLWRVAQDANT